MSDIVLVSPPDIPTAQLLFNEEETRKILKFFWPSFQGAAARPYLHPFQMAAIMTTYWGAA